MKKHITIEKVKEFYDKNKDIECCRYVVCADCPKSKVKIPVWMCKSLEEAMEHANSNHFWNFRDTMVVDLETMQEVK